MSRNFCVDKQSAAHDRSPYAKESRPVEVQYSLPGACAVVQLSCPSLFSNDALNFNIFHVSLVGWLLAFKLSPAPLAARVRTSKTPNTSCEVTRCMHIKRASQENNSPTGPLPRLYRPVGGIQTQSNEKSCQKSSAWNMPMQVCSDGHCGMADTVIQRTLAGEQTVALRFVRASVPIT